MRKELGYSHQYFIMCSAKLVRDKLVMTLYRKSLFGFYETIYQGWCYDEQYIKMWCQQSNHSKSSTLWFFCVIPHCIKIIWPLREQYIHANICTEIILTDYHPKPRLSRFYVLLACFQVFKYPQLFHHCVSQHKTTALIGYIRFL